MNILLVGGPEDIGREFAQKLAKDNVKVVEHWPGDKVRIRQGVIPNTAEAIVVLWDFIDHQGFYDVRAQARKQNIRVVWTNHKWAVARLRLVEKGIITPAPAPAPASVAPQPFNPVLVPEQVVKLQEEKMHNGVVASTQVVLAPSALSQADRRALTLKKIEFAREALKAAPTLTNGVLVALIKSKFVTGLHTRHLEGIYKALVGKETFKRPKRYFRGVDLRARTAVLVEALRQNPNIPEQDLIALSREKFGIGIGGSVMASIRQKALKAAPATVARSSSTNPAPTSTTRGATMPANLKAAFELLKEACVKDGVSKLECSYDNGKLHVVLDVIQPTRVAVSI